jgi:hypothetical protein
MENAFFTHHDSDFLSMGSFACPEPVDRVAKTSGRKSLWTNRIFATKDHKDRMENKNRHFL